MKAATVRCPHCDYENPENARFCNRCGRKLREHNPGPMDTRPVSLPDAPESMPVTPRSDTRPLPQAGVAFAPLPEGALLHDGRYVIVEVLSTGARLNVYLVEDTTPVRLCPNCELEIADHQESFCPSCGVGLAGVEPLHLYYRMKESANQQAFVVEAQLLGMQLQHAGILLPHDVFAEAPYGPPRHYLVEPEFSPPLATTLSLPQGLNQVLAWGVSLAQAMDYLHRHHIILGEVGLNYIAMTKEGVSWTNLGSARFVQPDDRPAEAEEFARDVQRLAAVLLHMATGRDPKNDVRLPEPADSAFSQALAAPPGISAADFAVALETALEELGRAESITLVVGCRTHVGRVRSLNEDSLLTLNVASVFRSVNTTPVGLFVVADGMGGHQAGDVASRLAVQSVASQAINEILVPVSASDPLPDAREWVEAAAAVANQRVYNQRKVAGTDMGTTMVMALVVGDTATIANIGDSRAYLLKLDELAQITTDHSLVERFVATGQITRREAANHPQRNVIYRVIGDQPQVKVDVFEQRLALGEALLLCSDGLSGMVSDEQIWQIWHTSTSPQEACDRLVEVANQAGGEDNVTVVIVQAVE